MKTTIALIVGFLLLMMSGGARSEEITAKNAALQQGSMNIVCTPDLYNLTSNWANAYSLLNPGLKINIIQAADNSKELGTGENLGFISGKSTAAIQNNTNWKMLVGRDITAPIINAENPLLNGILLQGVSPEQFAQIFQNPDLQNWGTILKGQNAPLHIYLTNDESSKKEVAEFVGTSQIPVSGIILGNSAEVVKAVQSDPYAIGFCKVANILNPDNQQLAENIRLLPIDKNGNGSIDYMENIYSDLNQFLRGVWIGKYPKALSGNIYAVSKQQPANEAELAFMTWILTDGQKYMNSNGYCELAGSESQSHLDKVNIAARSQSIPAAVNAYTPAGIALLILAVAVLLAFIVTAIVRHFIHKRKAIRGESVIQPAGFDENAVLIPNGLYFAKNHTWAFMEKDGTVTVGLDDFLQHITGPITRVEMKNPGEKIKKGELLFSIIQSGKQLNINAPVSGTIKEQNEALITNSSFINTSPYAEGWVYLIEPSGWLNEIPLLDMADRYKRWINAEFSRVKDFLAATLKPDSLEYSHVLLQDGGALKEGVLSEFGPEIWDDFQTNFLDTYK